MVMKLFRIKSLAAAAALGAALWAAPANAVTIPIPFQVELPPSAGAGEFTTGLSVGDTFGLDLDFIPTAASTVGGGSNPTYFNSVAGLTLTTPSATVAFDQAGAVPGTIDASVNVSNDGANGDSLILNYFGSASVNGLPGAAIFYQLTLNLIDDDGTAFADADLPTVFDFSLFETRNVTITAFGAGVEELHGNVIVSAVPVPAALPLMLSGLAGIAFIARKRRKAA